jgi:hypothetical protein
MSHSLARLILPVLERIFGPPPPMKEPVFPNDQILTPVYNYRAGFISQNYLYVFPLAAAIVNTQSGKLLWLKEGGYPNLPMGTHKLQYVDMHERTLVLSKVCGKSAEGSDVCLSVAFTWQVSDPLVVVSMQDPIGTLRVACEAAVKGLMRSYPHDQLVCVQDTSLIPDTTIARTIAHQLVQNQACRGFTMLNIAIIEREGDPSMLAIQEQRRLQLRRTQSEVESLAQQQKIVEQRKALKATEGEVDQQNKEIETRLAKMQAQFEAEKAEIMIKAQALVTSLELWRQQPERLQGQAMRGLDVRLEAIKALIEAQKAGGFPRNTEDLTIIQQIISGLPDYGELPGYSGILEYQNHETSPVERLSKTLERLMDSHKYLPGV